MFTGADQILGIGVEPSYGVPVTPSLALGIVLGGSVEEGADLQRFYGIASRQVLAQDYGRLECGGRCSLLAQDLSSLQWLAQRPLPDGELYSWTLDCGVSIYRESPGVSTLPRRMVGSKFNSMRLYIDVEKPLQVDLSWLSQAVIDGEIPEYSGPPNYPIWVPSCIILSHGGVGIVDLRSLEISIDNNLKPKYLASTQGPVLRALGHIEEGPQVITTKMQAYDCILPALRALPSEGYLDNGLTPLHGEAGFTIEVYLEDPCSYSVGSIQLLGCFQPQMEELLVPSETVEYSYQISAGSLVLYSY